jgi:hypothetical protein
MRSLLLTSAILIAAVGAPSRAKADDRAMAEQAFQEGRSLMAAGKVAEACPKFAAAAKLSPTAGVRLNLADCYAKLGKTASAWANANEALAFAEYAGDSAAADLARARMAALKPNLCYLTIAVSRETAPQGIEVSLDDEKISDAAWGAPFPVDPGLHKVTARAPGHKPSMKIVVMEAGVPSTVSVPVLVAEHLAEQPAEAPAPIAVLQVSQSQVGAEGAVTGGGWSRGTAHTLALVSGGTGLLGIAVGTGFGVDAISKKSGYQQQQVNGQCVKESCVTLSTEAVNAATASTIGFVVGGALAATGVVLWLTAPKRGSDASTVAVVPMVGAQSMGAGVLGSW